MMRRRTRQDGELANNSTSSHKCRVAAMLPFDGIFTIVGNGALAVSICYIRVKSPERACGAVGSALPWHGRGREFESHQVHQNVSNTYRPPGRQERSHRSQI